jgi:SAM-dependent methyltransferase
MTQISPYSTTFFRTHEQASLASAREILPLVFDLVKPRSVVDIGCGVGTWLAACVEYGIDDVLGVDGTYIDLATLKIPRERFLAHDLTERLSLERTYDLAMCMEVAEHLPVTSASDLVETLIGLAPAVLFSAAIPGQGGIRHVNEQWPEYWADLFLRRGYKVVDAIRKRVWRSPEVDMMYAQNALLFVREDYLQRSPSLIQERALTFERQLSVVHPALYAARITVADPRTYGPKGLFSLQLRLLRSLPRAIARAAVARTRRLRPGA